METLNILVVFVPNMPFNRMGFEAGMVPPLNFAMR